MASAQETGDLLVLGASRQAAGLNNPRLGNVQHYMAAQRLSALSGPAAEMQLELGDSWLFGGCLDSADSAYRSVLITFTGDNYMAFRQRAQLGIEDTRDARRAEPSKPEK